MTTTADTTSTHIPRFSAKDDDALSILIGSYTDQEWIDEPERVTSEISTLRNAASARACRRIAAKLTWMILDDKDPKNEYPARIAALKAMAEELESRA